MREILDGADLASLVAELHTDGAGVLMCVELEPEACHRSLVAERVAERFGLPVRHLRPEEG